MAEIKQLVTIPSLPGLKRDGTQLDGDNFTDAQWCRFQRGRPKKMGGFARVTAGINGPVRAMLVWSRGTMNNIYSFSGYGIDMVQVDQNGAGGSIIDRTPAGWTNNTDIMWSVDTIYDAAVGSNKTQVLALPTKTATLIDDTTEYSLYVGDASSSTAFTAVADVNGKASGGVFSTAPFTVLYGSDGKVTWSNENEPQNYTTGSAGSARVTGAKIVAGIPVRTGSAGGGILWSLDSVIRMDYIGGSDIFRFSPVSGDSSILASKSVVQYDNFYYWIGIDRFLYTNGSVVEELPNQMNLNWFFDNLNYEQRQKVWGMKVTRYGEIWWFFPFGDATECDHAIIYNVREKSWYDTEIQRSAGYAAKALRYPVMAGNFNEAFYEVTLSAIVGTFTVGEQVLGGTSGALALVVNVSGSTLRIEGIAPTAGETLTGQTSGAHGKVGEPAELFDLYIHEKGYNAVEGDNETAIDSWFETSNFGLPTGGTQNGSPNGLNRWTRLVRIEPDFIGEGNMTVEVIGSEFAQQPDLVSDPYPFDFSTEKIDMREQRRQLRLRFESNEVGGHYEMGHVILHTEPGDVRS